MLGNDSEGVTIERNLEAPGDGTTFPNRGDTVLIHYDGYLASGEKFDSSHSRGKPLEAVIGVGKLIKGWDVGVPQLSLREKATLIITPEYGYGEGGYPPLIPPNATLRFEVELVEIKKTGKAN